MKKKQYTTNDKVIHMLQQTDPSLDVLIRSIGSVTLSLEEDGFCCLVKYIIGQQISDKTRTAIWNKFDSFLGDVTPKNVLAANELTLHSIGLPQRKVECIRDLATKVISGEVSFNKHILMSNEEIIQTLTQIKGIGQWTAEMYLIFSLGRENVLSVGDGTIKRTIRWLFGLNRIPSTEQIKRLFAKWTNYETIVSLFLWAANSHGLTATPFIDLMAK